MPYQAHWLVYRAHLTPATHVFAIAGSLLACTCASPPTTRSASLRLTSAVAPTGMCAGAAACLCCSRPGIDPPPTADRLRHGGGPCPRSCRRRRDDARRWQPRGEHAHAGRGHRPGQAPLAGPITAVFVGRAALVPSALACLVPSSPCLLLLRPPLQGEEHIGMPDPDPVPVWDWAAAAVRIGKQGWDRQHL